MLIGLTNILVTFQNIIDYTLQPYLDRFIFYYINDILIYLKILEEYK